MKASEARLLLVGAPGRAGPRRGAAPRVVTVASFCRGPRAQRISPSGSSRGRRSWRSAEARPLRHRRGLRAAGRPRARRWARRTSPPCASPPAPPAPRRGSASRHGQLLWMAETMSALLPWKARIRAGALPLVPPDEPRRGGDPRRLRAVLRARLRSTSTFLEDFRGLSHALPRVRPTVFFSVPRFYEKVWERFQASGAGRLRRRLGPRRRGSAAAAPARHHRCGRCCAGRSSARPVSTAAPSSLVGSAPCPPSLLEQLPRAGHRAPQRLRPHRGPPGHPEPPRRQPARDRRARPCRPPRCGSPPTARCWCAGPRCRDAGALLPDGWLATGDLGAITPDGSLVIIGRKKEILITSYGKNIHPAKIEGPAPRDPRPGGRHGPRRQAAVPVRAAVADRRVDHPEALHAIDRAVRQDQRPPLPPRAGEALGGARGAPRHRERRADRQPEDPPAGRARPPGSGWWRCSTAERAAAGPAAGRSRRSCTWGPADAREPSPPLRLAAARILMPFGLRRQALEQLFARTAAAFGSAVPPPHAGARAGAARRVRALHAGPGRGSAAARGRGPGSARRTGSTGPRYGLGARYRLRLRGALPARRGDGRGAGHLPEPRHRFPRLSGRGSRSSAAAPSLRLHASQVCALVSALDRGLMAGLAGGGELRFRQRITEGA